MRYPKEIVNQICFQIFIKLFRKIKLFNLNKIQLIWALFVLLIIQREYSPQERSKRWLFERVCTAAGRVSCWKLEVGVIVKGAQD